MDKKNRQINKDIKQKEKNKNMTWCRKWIARTIYCHQLYSETSINFSKENIKFQIVVLLIILEWKRTTADTFDTVSQMKVNKFDK